MNGIDDGRFLAYLDDELPADDRAELEAWLEESPAAREALERVRRRADFVSRALTSLNGATARTGRGTPGSTEAPAEAPAGVPGIPAVPGVPGDAVADATSRKAVASAFDVVRNTVEATERNQRRSAGSPDGPSGSSGSWGSRRRLAQAATVVLLFTAAGVAAAVPGSPVRGFLASLLGDGPAEETATMSLDLPGPEVGVRAAAADGRLEVSISGLPDDASLVVRLVDGDRGAVYGPEGSRFLSGTGRIEATLPDPDAGGTGAGNAASPAPVRVEIPRSATGATLRVDGAIWLEKRGERLETPGRAARIVGDEVRFRDGSGS